MTITSNPSEISYAGDGVSTIFPIPFVFDTSADLKVIRTDSSGNPVVLTTGFSISGGAGSTGSLIMLAALAAGYTLTILDNPAFTQDADYTANDAFPAETHEGALDRGVRISKRIYQLLLKCVRVDDGDPSSGSGTLLGSVQARKGKYLFFNTITGAIEYATAVIGSTLSQSIIGQFLNPQTDAETAAATVPVNYAYAAGQLLRQQANTTPGTTDMQPGFQAAIDAASARDPNVYFSDECGIGKPLLIRAAHVSGIGLIGGSKATSIIEPLSIDIKQAAQNINCLIFNQNNNPHLRLENLRFTSVVAYTGVMIYCQESGGADSSGQCAFSAVLRNLFVDPPSTNSGFATGCWQNSVFESLTFESMKGCFTFVGAGSSDNHFANISLFNCYDHFILQTADALGSTSMSVNGLHAYNHQRGVLIEVKNWNGVGIRDVTLEPDAANLGSTGILKLTDCSNIVCEGLKAIKRTGVPQCAVGIEIAGTGTTSLKIANSKISANIGLKVSGACTLDVELVNVDFTECGTACIDIAAAAGGTLRTRGCKFNDSQLTAIKHSVGNSVSWFSTGDEFLNAGLSGTAGSRLFALNSSGVTRIANARLGQNNVSAAAAFYLEANGAGALEFIDIKVVGAPPTAFNTGAQVPYLDGVTGTWTPSIGGNATYTTQQGSYRVIQNVVYFWGRLTVNVLGTGSATTVQNLPYTNGATYYGCGIVPFFASLVASFTSLGIIVAPSANSFTFRTLTAAAAATGTASVLQNGADVIFSGSYPLS